MNYTDKQTKSTDRHFCPSCGVDYNYHNWLIPTCAELRKAQLNTIGLKKVLADYRKKVLADYRKEQLKFNKRKVEKIGKL